MKKSIWRTLCLLTFVFTARAQHYTFVRGSTLNGTIAGIYGTQGVAAAANNPGSRHGAARWTDAAGNLWMFGGEGNDINGVFGWLNDLWKYSVNTNQWTWIAGSTFTNQVSVYGTQGVAAAGNYPGAREFASSWTDAAGNFWLYGGDGFATSGFGRMGDLWKYNPGSGQWTWVKGFNTVNQAGVYGTLGVAAANNVPGARYGADTWIDASGKFWMLGGLGFDNVGANDYLNDFWRYDPATNQWTWMGGSTVISQAGAYGTMGVPSTTNSPGSRNFSSCWITAANELYVFGGYGLGAVATGYLNDLWKYNITTNTWTWISGSPGVNQTGVYGTQGVESALTLPGGRSSQAAWKDNAGNFWMFGGLGFSSSGTGYVNDLFKYNYCTNKWTWIKGSNLAGSNGTYGTTGVAAAANTPGAREYNIWWKGLNNTLWLFGARGFGSSGTITDNMNDLWRFDPPCFYVTIVSSVNSAVCSGAQATLSLTTCEGNIQWYSSPSGTMALGSGNSFTTVLLAAASQSVNTYYADVALCNATARDSINLAVNALPALSVTSGSLCNNSAAILTANGATSYTWNQSSTAPTLSVLPVAPAYNFTLNGTDNNGCTNTFTGSLAVNNFPLVLVASSSPSALCSEQTATLTASGAISYAWSTGATDASVTVMPTQTTSYTVAGNSLGCITTTVITQTAGTTPTVTIVSSVPLITCPGKTVTLYATGADTYSWNSGATSNTLHVTPNQTTTYTLTGITVSGCTTTAEITHSVAACLGIETIENEKSSAVLYPNPNNGAFVLTLNTQQSATLIIQTALGQTLTEHLVKPGINAINCNLPKGLYYYTVKDDFKTVAAGKLLID